MSVKAEIFEGRIYLESSFSDKEICKTVPGSKWDRTEGKWHVRLSWSACKQLRAIFGQRLEIGPDLLQWATKESQERVSPSLALRGLVELDKSHPVYAALKSLDIV